MRALTKIARRLRPRRSGAAGLGRPEAVVSRGWADEPFRAQVGAELDAILAGDVREGAKRLWSLAFGTDLEFARGLWLIWGGITDEHTHPRGDPDLGDRLALEAAGELRPVLGDPVRERAVCDHWVYERLSISPGPERIGEAIVLWTGHDESPWPDRGPAGEARLRERCSSAEADRLLTEIHRAAREFSASDAWITAPDLAEMGRQAAADFRTLRPDLPEAAVAALAWAYTYDNR